MSIASHPAVDVALIVGIGRLHGVPLPDDWLTRGRNDLVPGLDIDHPGREISLT